MSKHEHLILQPNGYSNFIYFKKRTNLVVLEGWTHNYSFTICHPFNDLKNVPIPTGIRSGWPLSGQVTPPHT